MSYKLVFARQAQQDARKLASSHLKPTCQSLLELIKENSFQKPPPFESLVGDLSGAISRRLNLQHRLVYQVLEEEVTIKVLRMWTHYE